MPKYSAVVREGTKTVLIKDKEYKTKADFIKDLRRNGYKVNPDKVKVSSEFNRILNNTNGNKWDWKGKKKK